MCISARSEMAPPTAEPQRGNKWDLGPIALRKPDTQTAGKALGLFPPKFNPNYNGRVFLLPRPNRLF